MPLLATKYFGAISYDESGLFHFPAGFPGFDGEKWFVFMDVPGKHPLVFLKSVSTAGLCFLAFPVFVIDPKYALGVSFEDLRLLDLNTGRQPRIGEEVTVLSLLSIPERGEVTANLMAPVVINVRNRLAVQAIRCDFKYSHQHAVPALAEEEVC